MDILREGEERKEFHLPLGPEVAAETIMSLVRGVNLTGSAREGESEAPFRQLLLWLGRISLCHARGQTGCLAVDQFLGRDRGRALWRHHRNRPRHRGPWPAGLIENGARSGRAAAGPNPHPFGPSIERFRVVAAKVSEPCRRQYTKSEVTSVIRYKRERLAWARCIVPLAEKALARTRPKLRARSQR